MTTDLHTTTNDVEPENDGTGATDTTNPPAEKAAAEKASAEKAAAAKTPVEEPAAEKPSARAQLTEYLSVRRHPVVAAVSMLCVAALVAVAVLAYLLVQRSDDLVAERQLTADKQTAETVAGRYAVGAATFDFNNLQPWSAALKNGTAPELNSRFDVAVNTLTPLIQEVQWVQTAKLIAAKTVDIRADRQFIVQVFVSTHMTSTQNPKGLNTVTPYTITLDRDSNWLITDVAGIAGAAQDGSSGSGTPNLTQSDAGSGSQGSSTQGNSNQGNSNQGSDGTGGQAPAAPRSRHHDHSHPGRTPLVGSAARRGNGRRRCHDDDVGSGAGVGHSGVDRSDRPDRHTVGSTRRARRPRRRRSGRSSRTGRSIPPRRVRAVGRQPRLSARPRGLRHDRGVGGRYRGGGVVPHGCGGPFVRLRRGRRRPDRHRRGVRVAPDHAVLLRDHLSRWCDAGAASGSRRSHSSQRPRTSQRRSSRALHAAASPEFWEHDAQSMTPNMIDIPAAMQICEISPAKASTSDVVPARRRRSR